MRSSPLGGAKTSRYLRDSFPPNFDRDNIFLYNKLMIIAFEGSHRSGKGTQIELLKNKLV